MASTRKDRGSGEASPDGVARPAADGQGAPARRRSRAGTPLSPDRAARIRELKQQIAEGTYQPDPHAIAREILKRGL